MMNPIKKKIVKVVLKKGAKELHNQIDTPEERKQIVERVKFEGMPPWASWVIAGLAALILEAISSVGFDLLIAGDYQAWSGLMVKTIGAKVLLMIDEEKEADVHEEEDSKA